MWYSFFFFWRVQIVTLHEQYSFVVNATNSKFRDSYKVKLIGEMLVAKVASHLNVLKKYENK